MEALTRTSVIRRENFFKGIYNQILGKKFSQVPLDVWKRGNRAMDLLLDVQERYAHDEISYKPVGVLELTADNITGNGRYSLDK